MNTSSLRLVTPFLIVIPCLHSSGLAQDYVSIGGQTGGQIFFNYTLPRSFNFGITASGSGVQIDQAKLFLADQQAPTQPVVATLYRGLGAQGTVLASGTVAASVFTSAGGFTTGTAMFGSTITLSSGYYSIGLTTLENNGQKGYLFKESPLTLSGTNGSILSSSLWVQDSNNVGTAGTTLVASGTVLATWTLGTNAMAFGNYRVGATLSATTPIVNTALMTSNTVTQALAVSAAQSGGISSISGLPSPYLSVGGTANLVAGLDGATTGPNTGTASLTFRSVPGTSLTTGTTAVGSGAIALSGTGWNWANASYSGTTFAFGYLHRGAAGVSGTVAIGNQALADASYQDALDVSAATGNPLVAATGFTGLAASSSEANRLIDGAGVRVDSNVVSDKALKLSAGTYVVQVGKRKFVRVTLS